MDIQKLDRVLVKDRYEKWHEFIVSRYVKNQAGISVYCEHSIYETYGDYITEKEPNGTPDHCLDVALENTRWSRSKNLTYSGESKKFSFYRMSAREAISMVLEEFDLIMKTEIIVSDNSIISRNVWLELKDGVNKGYRYISNKNAENVEVEVEDSETITSLYGYGASEYYEETGGYSRKIDFSSINGGLAYVEDAAAVLRHGRQIFGKIEFDDIEDRQKLLEATQKELETRLQPKVSYSGTVKDLNIGDTADVGEKVLLIDEALGVRVEGQVLKKVEYLDYTGDDTITLGNYNVEHPEVTRERIISELRNRLYTDPTRGALQATTLNQVEKLLEHWDEQMNAGLMEGKITPLPGGFLFETDNQATHIGPYGMRVADSKKPDGTWDFSSLITGEGLGANTVAGAQIVAGSITTDHISLSGISSSKVTTVGGATLDQVLTNMEDAVVAFSPEYYLSTDSTTPTGGSWSSTPPEWIDGRFIFTRTRIDPLEGQWYYTDPVNVTGAKGADGIQGVDGADGPPGADGEQGVSITEVVIEYAYNQSPTVAPTTGWSTTPPEWIPGRYIWQRTKVTFSNDDITYTTPQNIDTAAINAVNVKVVQNETAITDLGITVAERTTLNGVALTEKVSELEAGQLTLTFKAGGQNLLQGTTTEAATESIVGTASTVIYEGSIPDYIPAATPMRVSAYLMQVGTKVINLQVEWVGGATITATTPIPSNGSVYSRHIVELLTPIGITGFKILVTGQGSTTSSISYHSLKMEIGDIVTEWRPHAVDLHDGLSVTTANVSVVEGALTTKVDVTNYESDKLDLLDRITGKASISSVTALESLHATMLQTQNQWGVVISEIQSITGEHDVTVDHVNNYMTFGSDGLWLGRPSSSLRLNLKNNEIAFMDGSTKVAYISNQRLYINSGTIVQSLQVGNHVIEKWGGNVYTIVKPV